MNIQKVVRIICVIALQCLLIYEMIAIQGLFQWGTIIGSFRWYDWLLLCFSSYFSLVSIVLEAESIEEEQSDVYVGGRIINFLICSMLIWKTFCLQQSLPYPFNMMLICIVSIGLFAIFNFVFFLISILIIFGICFIWNYSGLDGFLLFFAVSGIVVIGLIIMIFILINKEDGKLDIIYIGRFMTCPECRKILVKGEPTNESIRGTIKTAVKATVGGVSVAACTGVGGKIGAGIGTFFAPGIGTGIGGAVGTCIGFVGGCFASYNVNKKIDAKTESMIDEVYYLGDGVELHFHCPKCGHDWYRYEKNGEIVR